VTQSDPRILLGCGLFQGYKVPRERNWAPLPVPPQEIGAAVLSHAHRDDSGWLPCRVKAGFRGPFCASAATRDLAEVLLLGSAPWQAENACRANGGGWPRHAKALPF
jgi:metallo-beta-lactamase family protein